MHMFTIDNGDAYVVGSQTGDHWYLYQTGSVLKHLRSSSNSDFRSSCPNCPDDTLEIIMTCLDTSSAKKFHLNPDTVPGHEYGAALAETCGLNDIFPVSSHLRCIDAYAFSPCGFSANVVVGDPDGDRKSGLYFTVHVTPEEGCSYASFGTNVPGSMFSGRETGEVVSRVVGTFLPESVCIIQFISHRNINWDWTIDGYCRNEKVVYEFDGYNFVFASFFVHATLRTPPE